MVSRSDEKCKSTFLINLNSYFAHLMLFSSKYCLCMWVPNVWIEYTLLTVVYGLVKRLTHKTHSYKSSFMFCPNFLFILNIRLREKVSVKFIHDYYMKSFCLFICPFVFIHIWLGVLFTRVIHQCRWQIPNSSVTNIVAKWVAFRTHF